MRRFLIKISLSVGVLFSIMVGYGAFCDFFFVQKRFLDLSEKKQWVLAQEGGNYDYAVLGSSRAFGAFDMKLLDSLTGWSGINLGANGSGFKDNYLVLNLFLESNKMKKLFLQVDMASLNSKTSFSNEFHGFTFLPYWNEKEVRKVLKEEYPKLDNALTSAFPQWRYFFFNKYFSPKEVFRRYRKSKSQGDPYLINKGGIIKTRKNLQPKEIKIFDLPRSASANDFKYLEKIVQLAELKGIEIWLFTAPRYRDNQESLIKILEPLEINKIYPEKFEINNPNLYIDQGHLSNSGMVNFTYGFSQEIRNYSR